MGALIGRGLNARMVDACCGVQRRGQRCGGPLVGWVGWGLNTPSCSSALRSAQRSVVRVRGKSTLLKENFVCALLLASVAQSVDSESCMELLVIVGN